MKRPTHIFVRLFNNTDTDTDTDTYVLSVVSFAEHPTLLKWISKYGTDCPITFPSVPYESVSDALPSFWGEMRRYAFCSIAEFFKVHWDPPPADAADPDPDAVDSTADPTSIEEMLQGQSVVFHPQVLEIEWVHRNAFDESYVFTHWFADMEWNDLLAMIRLIKPNETHQHDYFSRKIKYHKSWRKRMPSKLVCHFDNARDNEDDEIDSSYLDNC